MLSNIIKPAILTAMVSVGAVQWAEAQSPLGARASGMAGAFVGVADDASAVYWNPAGLATGAYASLVLDAGPWEALPPEDTPAGQAGRQTGRLAAISTPPLGFAYYRVGSFAAGPVEPAVSGFPGRQEVRRSVRALTTSTIGATLLQSLGEYVVVGTTLKLVRGSATSGFAGSDARGALDAAGELRSGTETTGDLDAGLMVAVRRLRVGLVAHNLTTPTFGHDDGGGEAVTLDRQVRVGGAWGSGWPGRSRVVVAVDADVTARTSMGGDRRDLAAGVETWWKAQRVGVRAGVRRSMIGDARPVVAAGASAGLTSAVFLEGHVARGWQAERSWSIGARMTF